VRISEAVNPLSSNEFPIAMKIESIAINPNSVGSRIRARKMEIEKLIIFPPICCHKDHNMPEAAFSFKLI
jgi:hypothetical protein